MPPLAASGSLPTLPASRAAGSSTATESPVVRTMSAFGMRPISTVSKPASPPPHRTIQPNAGGLRVVCMRREHQTMSAAAWTTVRSMTPTLGIARPQASTATLAAVKPAPPRPLMLLALASPECRPEHRAFPTTKKPSRCSLPSDIMMPTRIRVFRPVPAKRATP